jgi:hypothetical protein
MRLVAAFVLMFSAVFAVMPALAAPVFDSPETLIVYAYKPYVDGQFSEDLFELYTPGLRQLAEAAAERFGDKETGALDFDPFIDAQDYEDVHIDIGTITVSGDRGEAEVTVYSFGTPSRFDFSLAKIGEGWLIDDIARTDGEYPWRLSAIFADDPALN